MATERRPGARRLYHGEAAAAGADSAGGERDAAEDRSGGPIQGRGGDLPGVPTGNVAGAPVAPAAEAGCQAVEEGGVDSAVQAPFPLPPLWQGVHGARPGLRAGETYDVPAAPSCGGHAGVSDPGQPHVFLGLDGFCVRRPGRMWTGMWDLETKDSVAFVPGERQIDVQRMLERHAPRETVQAVAIDLST